MGYYETYSKRLNRYGTTPQERIQGKREHDFEVFMSKSPNQVSAWNNLVEGEPYDAVLQTKEYDQDEVVDYLLVPLDTEIPMGTIIYTSDSRHKNVEYENKKQLFTVIVNNEEKIYSARRWINYAIDPYTSSGYNRYTVVELESELSWVDNGIKYTSFAHATGGGSGARDKNINLKFSMQFSEAGIYLPNKRYSIVMPTNENLKKNMKITLGGETWRVTGFDNISVKGVSYVTLEETLTDEKEDNPIANAHQLKNWTVTTNLGTDFIVMKNTSIAIKLFFYYNNEPREVKYKILPNDLYDIIYEQNEIVLKTKSKTTDTAKLQVVIDGWDNSDCIEIPFSIKSYMETTSEIIGPKAVYMGEEAIYLITNAEEIETNSISLDKSNASILSAIKNEVTNEISVVILGKEIGENKLLINEQVFEFEVRSLWLGGGS